MDTWSVVRSPSDVLRAVVAAVLLLALLFVQWLWVRALVDFTGELLVGLSAVPTWLVDVIVIVTRLLAVVALVGGLVIAVRSGGWRMVGTAGLGAAIAAVLILLLERVDPRSGTTAVTVSDSLGPLTATGFPTAVGLGTVTAALTAAAPWVSRRARRIGWALVIALALNRFLITPASFDTLRAVLVGWLAGAAALVVLGGPSRRPTLAAVSAAAGRRRRAARPPGAGQRRRSRLDALLRRRRPTARPLFVKALGADERSADLLFRMYRTVQPASWATSGRSPRCDARSSTRRWWRWPPATLGCVTPRLVAFATARAQQLRPRLRGDRRPLARPGGARRAHRRVLADVWAQVVDAAPPPHRPPRPPAGQHLPRGRRRRSG